MPLFNDNSSLIVQSHPGFVSGKYYGSGFTSSYTPVALATGYVYYTYFLIPFNQNFTSISIKPNSAPSNTQKARIAIYTITNGLPSILVKDFGEVALNTSADREIINSIYLPAGWYAIAFVTNETSATIYCGNIINPFIGAPLINTGGSGFRAIANYQAFPLVAPTSNIANTLSPYIWLKTA